MKQLFTLCIFFLSSTLLFLNGFAQAPSIQWQKSFGGVFVDNINNVMQTFDGGYIMAGYSNSHDSLTGIESSDEDIYIVKTDENGNIEWQKTYGGSSDDEMLATLYGNSGRGIQQTKDSGYIIAATTWSTDGDVTNNYGNSDYWILKLDKHGNIQWQKTLGASGAEVAQSVEQTADGGYIISGTTQHSNDGMITDNHGDTNTDSPDAWIVRLDVDGNIVWKKCFGGSGSEYYGTSIKETKTGDFIMSGTTTSDDGDLKQNNGNYDLWVLKINAHGKVIWSKSRGYGGVDGGSDIIESKEGGYMVCAYSDMNEKDGFLVPDTWLLKLTDAGDLQWQQFYGGSKTEYPGNIIQGNDGGYIIAGSSNSNDSIVSGNHGDYDCWVMKVDETGNLLWQQSYGGSRADFGFSVFQTKDNGYALGCTIGSNDGDITNNYGYNDYWVVKLNPDIILPLKFLSINAVQVQQSVVVKWQTADETNVSYYIIERSADAVHYESIGSLKLKTGNTVSGNYAFTDNAPITGTSYYRIREVDNDGKTNLSKNALVAIKNTLLKVYPNPSVSKHFTVDLGSTYTSIIATIVNAKGVVMKKEYLTGRQVFDLNTNVAPGVYFLQLSYGANSDAIKIIIQ